MPEPPLTLLIEALPESAPEPDDDQHPQLGSLIYVVPPTLPLVEAVARLTLVLVFVVVLVRAVLPTSFRLFQTDSLLELAVLSELAWLLELAVLPTLLRLFASPPVVALEFPVPELEAFLMGTATATVVVEVVVVVPPEPGGAGGAGGAARARPALRRKQAELARRSLRITNLRDET